MAPEKEKEGTGREDWGSLCTTGAGCPRFCKKSEDGETEMLTEERDSKLYGSNRVPEHCPVFSQNTFTVASAMSAGPDVPRQLELGA